MMSTFVLQLRYMASEIDVNSAEAEVLNMGGEPETDMYVFFSILTAGEAQQYFSSPEKVTRSQQCQGWPNIRQ